jgi:hypothetical protein
MLQLLGTAMHAWGNVDEARFVLDQLISDHPDSRSAKRLVRVLERPAGEEPAAEIFVRPYRIRGVSPLTGAAY